MRPNSKQKEVCEFIISHATWWRDSNDINSTTHFSILESTVNYMVAKDMITESQAQALDTHLTNLLVEIRNIKED